MYARVEILSSGILFRVVVSLAYNIVMSSQQTHFESLYPVNTREAEIAKIASFVREGNSCQLIGLPGVGRSTLLMFLQKR